MPSQHEPNSHSAMNENTSGPCQSGGAVVFCTDFGTLLRLARAESKARESGDQKLYYEAKAEHESYRQVCLISDKMLLGTIF